MGKSNLLMNIKILRYLAIIISFGIVGALIATQFGYLKVGNLTRGSTGIAKIGGPFQLTDHYNELRTDADFKGRLLLIYFGYTSCPDVCPTGLQVISSALEAIHSTDKLVQPLFITVDPERDTPSRLKDYLSNFHPSILGMTGTNSQIKNAAKSFRVYFRKNDEEKDKPTDNYLMDHSSIIFLMDRKGRYLTHFSHQTQPSKLAAALRENIRASNSK